MPRHLTPGKICLLALTDLYIGDRIAIDARLSVLSFLFDAISPPTESDDVSLSKRFHLSTAPIHAFSDSLAHLPSAIPGRSIYDALLQHVWAWDGLDSFYNFFQHLHSLVGDASTANPSRASPMGQFIRRCHVEFTRLQFSDSNALWKAFEAYRQPSYPVWALRNPEAAAQRETTQPKWMQPKIPEDGDESLPPSGFSNEDTDALLSLSIHRLQRWGSRVDPPVRSKLERWISEASESNAQSLQHFLAFFDYWRAGQCTMAQESLQRYFDYSLVKQPGSDMKVYYQYALLHKSVLFADFERWEDSIDAMDECIATARENQDTACLNFALSWLMYLRSAYPRSHDASFASLTKLLGGGNGEQDEIAFLKTKALEGKHWSLLSSTLLEEAKLEAQAAGNSPRALEPLVQAAYLNVQHDLRALMPATAIFQGAVWERLGQCHLSRRSYETVHIIHKPHSPLADFARSSCRLARSFAQSGNYEHSFRVLRESEAPLKGVLKLEQRHQVLRDLTMLQRHLRHGALTAAQAVLNMLDPFPYLSDPELASERELMEIELMDATHQGAVRASRIGESISKLHMNNRAGDIAQFAHLLILYRTSWHSPDNDNHSFTALLRAAAIALRCMLMPTMIMATSGIANILVRQLEEFGAARDLLEAIIPFALESSNPEVTGDCYITLADSYCGLARGLETSDPPAHSWMLGKALAYLKAATEIFASLEHSSGKIHALANQKLIYMHINDRTSASHVVAQIAQAMKERAANGASSSPIQGMGPAF